jgi:hypothetical protein
MAELTSRPMRLFLVEFNELYARHLCRHSQTGINIVHLFALAGIWYSIYGLLCWLTEVPWILAVPASLYVAVLAPNVPVRILGATCCFLALIVTAVLLLPQPPFWVHLIAIPVLYKVQSWSHRIYTVERDMTEFNKKYPKGYVLFVILLIYEVPIVLAFLFSHWSAKPQAVDVRGHAGEAPLSETVKRASWL